jgi:hypothetical protein
MEQDPEHQWEDLEESGTGESKKEVVTGPK